MPSHTPLAFTALFTGLAIVLSEMTSNTASASMVVPVAIAVCEAAGVRAIEPALGATLGASVGFMLPDLYACRTPSPTAPVTFRSATMMKHGVALDVVSFVVIVIVVSIMGPRLF